jgi:prepilin-type N-terminal cleavage/methylation domain-containing protein
MVERKVNRQKGFTLIELAGALIIIGLLIGGILVGQSMVSTAKDLRIIRDVEKYQVAIRLFENQYNYLPGNATACSTGNSKNHWFRGTSVEDWNCSMKGFTMFGELSNMGMLDQKYNSSYLSSGYGNNTNEASWPGIAIPKMPNGAALFGTSNDNQYNSDLTTGLVGGTPLATTCATYNFLRLSLYDPATDTGPSVAPTTIYNNFAIDSVDANAIDSKMDDGNGSTGKVLAEGRVGTAATWCKTGGTIATGNYTATSNINNCLLYFCGEPDAN